MTIDELLDDIGITPEKERTSVYLLTEWLDRYAKREGDENISEIKCDCLMCRTANHLCSAIGITWEEIQRRMRDE